MPQTDTDEFRLLVCRLLPGLEITGVARPSGQRIVYFGNFNGASDVDRKKWDKVKVQDWGDVVVKISSGLTDSTVTYLQREKRILSEIDSDHYPKMYFDDVCSLDPETDGPLPERLFVTVEEFVPSVPLSECQHDYATEPKVVSLLLQVATALAILWEQKPPLVHRDIKPDNILVKNCGSIVIIDLGIAREAGSDGVTATDIMVGPCTPDFTSPEQARNDKRNISFKSDIFILGILAHVLLAKTNPFRPDESQPAIVVLNHILYTQPDSLKTIVGASDGLSDLVTKMLQKEPYRRPRTPGHFVQSLADLKESYDDN